MKDNAIKVLVLLNVALLASFFGGRLMTGGASENAAFAQNRPRPGDYLMIPGEVTGGSTSVVYMIDMTNGWLSAMAYDDTVKRLEIMPGRIDLATVFTQRNGGNMDDRQPDGTPPANNKSGKRGY